jgi:hypothetical protein
VPEFLASCVFACTNMQECLHLTYVALCALNCVQSQNASDPPFAFSTDMSFYHLKDIDMNILRTTVRNSSVKRFWARNSRVGNKSAWPTPLRIHQSGSHIFDERGISQNNEVYRRRTKVLREEMRRVGFNREIDQYLFTVAFIHGDFHYIGSARRMLSMIYLNILCNN